MDTNWNKRDNFSMLTDFYEMTMANGYLERGNADQIAYFDLFFRQVPENGGYAIMAGVEQMVDYLNDLSFTGEDLQFLRDKYGFSENFLAYLRDFSFACDVWAIPEGTPIFPGEPLVKVRGPMIQAQMIETMLLVTINHQSLIATKASRIVRAAEGRPVLEFGARRAQGYDASVLGARAAYIAGVAGTSCTLAGLQFDIPLSGTMAHSWVQLFETEYDAFVAYAKTYPDNTLLLVDTFNVLKSGVPNAIAVAKDVLKPMGKRLKGIRIDSGDLTYLSQESRKLLDAAGMEDCKITASNALDEYIIRDLLLQGARIDAFGVGERLITSRAEPVFGGVYKLSAVEKEGEVIPKMKISENVGKITNPCSKDVYRLYDKTNGKAIADVIAVSDESIDEFIPYELFDPIQTWKRKRVTNFTARRLLLPVYQAGRCVYNRRSTQEIRSACFAEMETLWESTKRFENPHNYYVDLSQKLWDIRNTILNQYQEI